MSAPGRFPSLKLANWPEADGASWLLAQEPADPFEPSRGYAMRWRPSTLALNEAGYGHWLAWLLAEKVLDPSSAPGERITEERVRRYRDAMRAAGLADNTIAGRLQNLCNVLRAISPEGDWDWIHRGSTRIYASAKPVRDIVGRMQPPEQLIELGQDLMAAAENDRFRTPRERATLFRDGLIIWLLVLRPLRLANLQAITIGRHLERQGERWRLAFDAAEMKNAEPLACSWPEELVSPLEKYIEVHRPHLLACAARKAPTDALWISRQGKAMGGDAIAFEVCYRTKETFGVTVNPHLFRHIAATTIATVNPACAADIMAILGHTSITASEKHYNRARMLGAGEAYHVTVGGLRKRARGSERHRALTR